MPSGDLLICKDGSVDQDICKNSVDIFRVSGCKPEEGVCDFVGPCEPFRIDSSLYLFFTLIRNGFEHFKNQVDGLVIRYNIIQYLKVPGFCVNKGMIWKTRNLKM